MLFLPPTVEWLPSLGGGRERCFLASIELMVGGCVPMSKVFGLVLARNPSFHRADTIKTVTTRVVVV